MKVLIICSINSGKVAPFIIEQVDSLHQLGIEYEYFTINKKGILGYLKHYILLKEKIRNYKPDLIHAHYGLSGLLANLQRSVPVITTYHGSDINNSRVFYLSLLSIYLSSFNIFVSKKNLEKVNETKKSDVIPCGINITLFQPKEKIAARKILNISKDEKMILFAGAFNNKVKNYALAQKALQNLKDIKLIELKAYTREQVSNHINACNLVLMTSFTEGSPQIIKESMACNIPIVSVDVGDVKELVTNVEGCYICSNNPLDIEDKIKLAISFSQNIGFTNGRNRIIELGLDGDNIAQKIHKVYTEKINVYKKKSKN